MSGDPSSNPDFVGVKQAAFDTMAGRHSRAASQLDQLAQALWAELNKAQLDTSPALRIRDMAGRVRKQAADLQRRQRLVHEMERQKITFGFKTPKGTFWELPDRLDALQSRLDGAEAADLAKKAAGGDRKALSRLTKFASEANNPDFAKSLLDRLGADGIITLPAAFARRLRTAMDSRDPNLGAHEASVQSVLKMFSTALAVGTNPGSGGYVGDAYLNKLKGEGNADHRFPGGGPYDTYKGYQSLATLLGMSDGHPPYSVRFMQVVGRDMIAYDREHRPKGPLPGKPPPVAFPYVPGLPHHRPEDSFAPLPDLIGLLHLGWALTPEGNRPTVEPPGQGRTDFLNGLMRAASFSKDGSQALLHYTPSGQKNSDLEYLLHERRTAWAYTDHGLSLSLAMKAAMSGRDQTSQKLFKEMSELLGRDTRQYYTYDKDHKLKFNAGDGHADDLSGLRPNLGDILRSHLGDLDDSLFGDKLATGSPETLPSPRDIDALLAEVGQDDQAFANLVKDQIGRTRAMLDQQYANGNDIDNVLISEGKLLGHLLAMRREALIGRGTTTDAANQEIKDLINRGIGLVPIPYTSLFGGVSKSIYDEVVKNRYGKVGDWLNQQVLQGGGSAQQDSKTASDEQAVVKLLGQISLSVAIDHANDSGQRAPGEPFADNSGHVLPPDKWMNDPDKNLKFIEWCRKNGFVAPKISSEIETQIKNSHDDAVSSFNDAKPGELQP
jgi:hypothetical protein